MDKSKLIASIALAAGVGAILYSQNSEAPKAPAEEHFEGDGHDHGAKASPTPKFDVVGGVTKLQIKDVKVGTGKAAKNGDEVAVNYRGTLLNGFLFDESKSDPFSFGLGAGKVIKGWDEGIVGMKVGGKRQLTIPAALAYGKRGSPPKIPADATLKFDVELLEIQGKS